MTVNMHAVSAMLNMGIYGRYVWSCYGLFAAMFSLMPMVTKRNKSKLIAELKQSNAPTS